MDITIDTSAIIAVIADEPHKDRIIACTVGANLNAPASIHWEMGNAFSAMLKRRRITSPQAQACLQIYYKIPIKLLEVDLIASLNLAHELKIYAYDAYLIQCALEHKTPLLSLDKGLLQKAKAIGITILE